MGDNVGEVTMREGGFLRTSDPCGELYGALAKAQVSFLPIKKTKVNPYYHSKYADLADVITATQAALSANGLCVIQGAGTDTDARVVYISTRLAHASGQWVEHVVALPGTMRAEKGQPERFDSQSVGAAITYGRRYGRSAILGVASDEDDDGNAAVGALEGNGTPERPAQEPDGTPANPYECPSCHKHAVIKGAPKYGGGWVCWKKKEGCGAKWDDAAWAAAKAIAAGGNMDVGDDYVDADAAGVTVLDEMPDYATMPRAELVKLITSGVLAAGELIKDGEREMYRESIKTAKDNAALVEILKDVERTVKHRANKIAPTEAKQGGLF